MADRKLTGAVAIGGTVYRAGQEAELEAAAKAAKIDLADERFAASFGEVPAPAAAPESTKSGGKKEK